MVFEQEEHVYIYCNSFSELAPVLQRELILRILKYINEKGHKKSLPTGKTYSNGNFDGSSQIEGIFCCNATDDSFQKSKVS